MSTRAQNAKYSGDKKAKFTSIPSLTLSRYLLTEIRAKHGTGRIGAKRYGAHMGYGAGAVRGTVWARYVARTFHRVQPVRATYRAPLGALTAYCWDCPYHTLTGMFTGTLPSNCFFRCSVHYTNGQPDN